MWPSGFLTAMIVSVALAQPSHAQVEWTVRNPSPLAHCFFNSVTWGDSQFVAVGVFSNRPQALPAQKYCIATSRDGETWDVQRSDANWGIRGVVWVGDRFYAVGESGLLQSSRNGRTWTAYSTGTDKPFNTLAKSDSLYVAMGDQGLVSTSSDGETWNTALLPTQPTMRSIVWADSQWVAVGTLILTSPDGTSWTPRNTGIANLSLHSVAWDGSNLVAVGDNGAIFTSRDGATWQISTSPIVANYKWVKYLGDQFLAVDGTQLVASGNGLSWTRLNPLPSRTSSIAQGAGGKYVFVGWTGFISPERPSMGVSQDLETWRTIDHASYVEDLNSVVWTGSQLVAVGNKGTILTSEDGVEWTKRESGSSDNLMKVIWSNSQLVVVGSKSAFLISSDGVDWSFTRTGSQGTYNLNSVVRSEDLFVAAGTSATFAWSPDGTNWDAVDTWLNSKWDDFHTYYSLAFGGDRYVAVGAHQYYDTRLGTITAGKIATSENGSQWAAQTITNSEITDVVWDGSQFLAIAPGIKTVLTSPNGLDWTKHLLAYDTGNLFRHITWLGDQYMLAGKQERNNSGGDIVGRQAAYTFSSNGTDWGPIQTSQGLGSITGAVSTGKMLVVVGPGGAILTSPLPPVGVAKPRPLAPQRLRLHLSAGNLSFTAPTAFRTGDMRAQVYTLRGDRTGVGRYFDARKQGSFVLPTSSLAPGGYLLEVRNGGRREVAPFFLIR